MKTTIRYHHMPIRMAKIENKKQKKRKQKNTTLQYQVVVRMQNNWPSHTLLVRKYKDKTLHKKVQ